MQHDAVADGVHVSCDLVAYDILGRGAGTRFQLVNLD